MHEVYDGPKRADAIAVCSSFAASKAVYRAFDRAHGNHLLHATVVPLPRAVVGALFDMYFR